MPDPSPISPVSLFDTSVIRIFRLGISSFRKSPRLFLFFLRHFRFQKQQRRLREQWRLQGVYPPAILIVSVTQTCNLKCKGCYAQLLHTEKNKVLESKTLIQIVSQAEQLGFSIVMLAGGEPFTRNDLIELTQRFRRLIFPVFTNGTLITTNTAKQLKNSPNLIPVISLEGHQAETDSRRGEGVWISAMETMNHLQKNKVFFGCSFTATSSNIEKITDKNYIESLITLGCKIFFFVEYVPVNELTDHLVLTQEQRIKLIDAARTFEKTFPGIFICFPGDEEKYGGCLAAGRGFIHINASGQVEACPFAPFSDSNISTNNLQQAIQSPLMTAIRENHHLLTETSGGCALWNKKEWVESLQQNKTTN